MKNIFLFLKSNISRNILSISISIFGGIMMCWIIPTLGNQFGDYDIKNMFIGIIDEDQSLISSDFKNYLTNQLDIEIVEDLSYDQLTNDLLNKKISVIIEIPKDYEQNAIKGRAADQLEITALDDYENIAFIKSYIDSYFASIDVMLQSADSDRELFESILKNYQEQETDITQISASKVDIELEKGKKGFILAMGFFVMFSSSCGLFVSFIVFDDRKNGVFRRIQAAPVKPVQYIIGTSVFAIIVGWIWVGIICGFLAINNYPTGIPLGIMMYMMMTFVVISVVISLLIGLLFESKSGVAMGVITFSTLCSMMSGAYFPIDTAPQVLQNIAKIMPHYWLMQGFKDIQNNPQADISANIIVMALFILLFFLMNGACFVQKTSSRN